ncbi:MAG: hypothetical protein KDA22_06430 [Phycisphaerales bacterium]|nr:hypothetical protein [Phycisphaerales bacterium]
MRPDSPLRAPGLLSALGIIAVLSAAPSFARGSCVPTWDGTLGTPGMSSGYVDSLIAHDDGSGNGVQLFATGNFASAGGNPGTALIARWNGSSWVGVGGGLQNQFSNVLGVYQGELYVGGYFDSAGNVPGTAKLAKWNGTEWVSIGAQLESFLSSVWSFQVYDDGDGEDLYIGGNFLDIGGTTIDHIARWDGENFTEVGGTIVGPNQIVLDMRVYKGELYACGRFQTVAGVPAANIARWNGTEWQAVGGGLPGTQVICMEVVGDDLYAGGSFTTAQGSPGMRIARWDGAAWHPLGPGLNSTVQDIEHYDDGSGDKLYVVGSFSGTGDNSVLFDRIAVWDGVSWSGVGSGADATVFESYVWDDGSGPALLIGGSLTSVDGVSANRVAAYVGCPVVTTCETDLNGDGMTDGADLGLLLAAWGDCPAGCAEDLNGDGTVNGADLGLLLGSWGPCL